MDNDLFHLEEAEVRKKKYRLKKEVGGYLALTSGAFECIMKGSEERELTDEELNRMSRYVEEVPPVPIEKKKERTIDFIVEDNK